MSGALNHSRIVPQYEEPSDEVLKALKSVPWCSKILSDPSLEPSQSVDRVRAAWQTNSFMSETLATSQTIKIWQFFHRNPCADAPLGEMIFIASLGAGLNGHKDTAHGGIISLILDEAMGLAAVFTWPPKRSIYTVTMTVEYKRAIPTPSIVLCRARSEKNQGRKRRISSKIEDGEGGVYATGTALYVEAKESSKM